MQREHGAILQNRDDKGAGFNWEEYRQSMTFTSMVRNSGGTLKI